MAKAEFREFNETPEEGMVLIGFSCNAVLEGRELKQELLDLVTKKDKIGIRDAVALFKSVSFASFDEALRVVKQLAEDFHKVGRNLTITQKTYPYTINRVFWMHEADMPKNDPRYFKLKVLDCKNIDLDKYQGTDKKFDAKAFIGDFMDENQKKAPKKQSMGIRELEGV